MHSPFLFMNWTKAKQKQKYLLIPVYLLCCLISYLTGIKCVWKALFGINCPGCGFTRAVFCLFKLEFKAAFEYHPMVWSFFIIVIFFVFEGEVFRNKKLNVLVISLIGAGFLFVWIYRLYMGICI